MKWVVDASVAAKWLAPENDSDLAAALLDDELLAPDLLFAEVANILWKKQMRAEMDAATANAAARWLTQAPLHVHDCASLVIAALDLSTRLQHPAYDCFYLALARAEACSLITADRRLFERCQQDDARDLAANIVLLAMAPKNR
jgi:predicted nucleic acid-binding protein